MASSKTNGIAQDIGRGATPTFAGLTVTGAVTFSAAGTAVTITNTVQAGAIQFGTTPATAGPVRLSNNTTIQARNSANTADVGLIGLNDATVNEVEVGTLAAGAVRIGGTSGRLSFLSVTTPIVQRAATADASGGATIDAEARTAINAVLADLRAYGLKAT